MRQALTSRLLGRRSAFDLLDGVEEPVEVVVAEQQLGSLGGEVDERGFVEATGWNDAGRGELVD